MINAVTVVQTGLRTNLVNFFIISQRSIIHANILRVESTYYMYLKHVLTYFLYSLEFQIKLCTNSLVPHSSSERKAFLRKYFHISML